VTPADDAVVVATCNLDEPTVRQVAMACDRLHARYVPWSEDELANLKLAPWLVVAGLPAGKRRVPDPLMKLCTETHPGTPLLMLCQEKLVSPTVSLHSGQILLVGPPLSATRIQSRIAAIRAELKAGDQPPSVVTAVDDPSSRVWTRERLHADLWLASFGCRGPSGSATYQPVVISTGEGAIALIPQRAGVAISEGTRQVIIDLARAPAPTLERIQRLGAAAPELAIVTFDRVSEEWGISWPQATMPLWLHAEQRLPSLWNLGKGLDRYGVTTLKAYAGDLVLGLTTSPATFDPRRYAAGLAGGGHALLGAIERELEASPRSVAGIVLEVRS
jgi:hypothetical protein